MVVLVELAVLTVLVLNVLQSVYALRYPRAAVPSTPASKNNKALSTPANSQKEKRKLGGLSPNVRLPSLW